MMMSLCTPHLLNNAKQNSDRLVCVAPSHSSQGAPENSTFEASCIIAEELVE